MEALREMFPDMKQDTLQIVFDECDCNLERAIDTLLNMETIYSSPENIAPINPHSSKPTSPPLASAPTSTAPTAPLSQLELDELLAKELASSMSDIPPSSFNRPSYSNKSFSYHDDDEAYTVPIESIDKDVMAEIMNSVKSSMIPILLQQLNSLRVPPVDEQIDAGKLGMIRIALDQIRVAEATVPEEHVNIQVQELNHININVQEIAAKLHQFTWSYEKNTFPKVKDSGNANASITKGTISVTLKIGIDSYGNPNLSVTKCEVNIGALDVSISGSFASFVYNTLLGLFKKSIKSTLETSLASLIQDSVNNDSSINMF
jgi:hypothetical protein